MIARLAAVALVACSPAPIVRPPAPVVAKPTATPAKPTRVIFPFAPFQTNFALDLGEARELRVGAFGRRVLARGPAVSELAPLPEPIGAALRVGDGVAYVGESGRTYWTNDFGGTPVEMRKPPPLDARTIRSGKGAFFIGDAAGAYRSTDAGRTWERVAISHPGAFSDLVVDKKGEGLLAMVPQRLFATKDDGATWTAIDSMGLGYLSLRSDASGLWVQAVNGTLRLSDGKLVTDKPTTKNEPPSRPRHSLELAGPWLVAVEHNEGIFTDIIGLAGGSLKPTKMPCAMDHAVVGDEHGIFATCFTYRSLHRWTPGGGWKELVAGGEHPIDYDDLPLAANGNMVWLGRSCPDGKCGSRSIAFDGATFADAKLDANGHVRAVAFDPESHRGYVVAEDNDRLAIYASGALSPTFDRTPWLDLDAKIWRTVRATVDDAGVLRVATCLDASVGCALHAFREGVSEPTRYLARANDVALVGKRAMTAIDGLAFETADGGRTWTLASLPSNEPRFACSPLGCVRDQAVRIGWGEPHPLVTIESSTQPIAAPPPIAKPQKRWSCQPTAAALDGAVPDEVLVGRDGFAWIERTKDDRVLARTAVGGKIIEVELFAKPKSKAVHVEVQIHDGIAIRLARKTTGSPPEVDVAWLPGLTSKPVRASLPGVPFFAPAVHDVAASRVNGGIVVRVGLDSVYFVDHTGKVKPLPDVGALFSFARVGKGFVAARPVGKTLIQLSWSGKVFASWRLAENELPRGFDRLLSTPSGAFLGVDHDGAASFLRIPETRAADPTEFAERTEYQLLETAPPKACTERMAAFSTADRFPIRERAIAVDGEPSLRTLALTPSPRDTNICDAFLAGTLSGKRVVIPASAPGGAWILDKAALRPLECKLE